MVRIVDTSGLSDDELPPDGFADSLADLRELTDEEQHQKDEWERYRLSLVRRRTPQQRQGISLLSPDENRT